MVTSLLFLKIFKTKYFILEQNLWDFSFVGILGLYLLSLSLNRAVYMYFFLILTYSTGCKFYFSSVLSHVSHCRNLESRNTNNL